MERVARHLRQILPASVVALAAALGSVSPASAEPGVVDNPRYLVLLCKFAGTKYQPRSAAAMTDLFNASGRQSITDYFRDQSYGTLVPQFTVRGWFPMAQTRRQYNDLGDDRATKARWCIEASRLDPNPYSGVVVITNEEGDTGGLRARYTFSRQSKEYAVTVLWGYGDVSVAVHEIAHGMGLYAHSWYTTTPTVEQPTGCDGWNGPKRQCQYGDPTDVMSAALVWGYPDTQGYSGPGFNGHNRQWFGWLPPNRIETFTTGLCETKCSRTYDLADLSVPGIAGLQLIKIPTGSRPGNYFTVEYRRRLGWEQGFFGSGVSIHEVRENGLAYLVRRADENGTPWWGPKQTWTSEIAGVSVSVVSETAGRARVVVTRTPPAASWTRIGGATAGIVPTGSGLYLLSSSGVLEQYRGTPGNFVPVSDPTLGVGANDRLVFAIDVERGLSRFDGNRWVKIGSNSAGIVAGAESVYSVDYTTGTLKQYLGTPGRWRNVGGRCAQAVVNEQGLFCLSPDRQAVHRYTGRGTVWEQVGGPKDSLVVTPTALFGTEPGTGNIQRWDGRFAWTTVGGPGAQFVGNEEGLYGLTSDRNAVMFFTGTPGVWTQIGGAAAELAAGGTFLYALSPDRLNLMMYHR